MNIQPLHNTILFSFEDETKNGFFIEKHTSGLIVDLGRNHKQSADYCRSGVVKSVGPTVKTVKVGDRITIKALMWTTKNVVDGQDIWMTEEKHVVGIIE